MILFLSKLMIIMRILILNFLDGDLPGSSSYRVHISQPIHFARTSSYVAVNASNFLNKVNSIINFAKPFLNFIKDILI